MSNPPKVVGWQASLEAPSHQPAILAIDSESTYQGLNQTRTVRHFRTKGEASSWLRIMRNRAHNPLLKKVRDHLETVRRDCNHKHRNGLNAARDEGTIELLEEVEDYVSRTGSTL